MKCAPLIFTISFGTSNAKGLNLVPSPPASITACNSKNRIKSNPYWSTKNHQSCYTR